MVGECKSAQEDLLLTGFVNHDTGHSLFGKYAKALALSFNGTFCVVRPLPLTQVNGAAKRPEPEKQDLSQFTLSFSIGSVVSASLALAIFPGRTCLGVEDCDVDTHNSGWRYLLQTCGIIVS